MAGSRQEMDMVHGPLAGRILLFAMPIAASACLQQLFNAADLAVVGRFASSQAMAAVGSNGSVINLIVGLFMGLSAGANVHISHLIGAEKREKISDAVHTVIAVGVLLGFFLLGLGIYLAPKILVLMGAPEEVLALAVLYLRIYFLGMPMIMLYNYGSAILRSKGDSRRPLVALTLSGILNVLLNLVFVIGFRLHVIGVASATVISNSVAAALTIGFLLREEGEFQLDLRKLRIVKESLVPILRIGLPAGVQGSVFSLSNVVIQSAVNGFGALAIAGNTAAQNMEFVSFCLMNGFTQAAVTFTSQNYGAGRLDRCRRVYRICLLLAVGLDMIPLTCFRLFQDGFIGIFTADPEVMAFARLRLTYVVSLHFLMGVLDVTGGAIRGLGYSMVPMIISILGTCVFRLVYVLVILPHIRSFTALLLVYPISWLISIAAMYAAYVWIRAKCEREAALGTA